MAVDRFSNAAGPNTGLILMKPTSVTVGSGTATTSNFGQVTFSGASSVLLNGVFTSEFDNYKIFIHLNTGTTSAAEHFFRYSQNGSVDSSNAYSYAGIYNAFGSGTSVAGLGSSATSGFRWYYSADTNSIAKEITIMNPYLSSNRTFSAVIGSDPTANMSIAGKFETAKSFDGIQFFVGGTLTGTVRVYGLTNGA